MMVSVRRTFVTKPWSLLENIWLLQHVASTQALQMPCQANRLEYQSTVPALDLYSEEQLTHEHGRYCVEVEINSVQNPETISWIEISR